MRAVMFEAARKIDMVDIADPPDPRGDQVLVRPLLCGICGTDLHEYTDGPIVIPNAPHPLNSSQAPQILGHEFSAEVVDTGPDVTGLRPGQVCSVMPLLSCGRCPACRRGLPHLCAIMACTGLSDAWGGLADRALVAAGQCVPVPEELSPLQAALVEPTAVAAYGVDRGGVEPGDVVMITGAGPIGSLAAMYALVRGARLVIVFERNQARRERIATLVPGDGRIVSFEPGSGEAHSFVAEHTEGAGVDVAVECAGNEAALNTCLESVRGAGTVVQTALHTRPATISAELIAHRDLTLVGTWCYPTNDFGRIAGLMASGQLPAERVVTSRVPLEETVTGGFDRLVTQDNDEVKILIEVGA